MLKRGVVRKIIPLLVAHVVAAVIVDEFSEMLAAPKIGAPLTPGTSKVKVLSFQVSTAEEGDSATIGFCHKGVSSRLHPLLVVAVKVKIRGTSVMLPNRFLWSKRI
jgi:hypothetical protein